MSENRHEQIAGLLLDFCNRQGVLFIKDLTLAHLTTWQSDWSVKAPQARRSRQEKVKNFLLHGLGNDLDESGHRLERRQGQDER